MTGQAAQIQIPHTVDRLQGPSVLPRILLANKFWFRKTNFLCNEQILTLASPPNLNIAKPA